MVFHLLCINFYEFFSNLKIIASGYFKFDNYCGIRRDDGADIYGFWIIYWHFMPKVSEFCIVFSTQILNQDSAAVRFLHFSSSWRAQSNSFLHWRSMTSSHWYFPFSLTESKERISTRRCAIKFFSHRTKKFRWPKKLTTCPRHGRSLRLIFMYPTRDLTRGWFREQNSGILGYSGLNAVNFCTCSFSFHSELEPVSFM